MSLFPRTPSFTNLSFVDALNLLTGHSYLRHTLQVFVGPSGLTLLQIVPLPSTHHSDWLSSSVCNLMRRCPMHLLTLAYGAWKSPLIYPASRILSAGQPRYIPSYLRCSDDSDSWCWDSTTQAASDDAPSKHRGWRGLLSVSSEVRACHGRATMPGKSSRESICLTRAPFFQVIGPNTLCLLYSLFPISFELHIVGVKTTGVYLSTVAKPLLCYSTSPRRGISGFSL